MGYDEEKVDEVVLALLYLTSFEDHGMTRAWRGQDWGALDRLFQKGFISDPRSKAKSVILTDDGWSNPGFFSENTLGDRDRSPIRHSTPRNPSAHLAGSYPGSSTDFQS